MRTDRGISERDPNEQDETVREEDPCGHKKSISEEDPCGHKKSISEMDPYEQERAISDILSGLGIKDHYKGYDYLIHALMLICTHPESVRSVGRELYPHIAEAMSVPACRIERNIRTTISGSTREDISMMSNKEFLIYAYAMLQLSEH